MVDEVKLKTSDSDINELYELANNVRKDSEFVKVPVTQLKNLLADHSNMWGKLHK